jgi:hypothetical protein
MTLMGKAYKELDISYGDIVKLKGSFQVFEVTSKKEADVGGSEDTYFLYYTL